jgi:hypothetical protein
MKPVTCGYCGARLDPEYAYDHFSIRDFWTRVQIARIFHSFQYRGSIEADCFSDLLLCGASQPHLEDRLPTPLLLTHG